MSWITPVVTWIASHAPLPSDFNRIEGNIKYLKDRGDADRTITLLGDVSGSTVYDDNGGMDISVTVKDNSHSHVSSDISDGQSAATPNSVMLRDSSGNTAVHVLTADRVDADLSGNSATSSQCTGNSETATRLQNARTISVSGDATGYASFDGSSDITISLDVTSSNTAGYTEVIREQSHGIGENRYIMASTIYTDPISGKTYLYPVRTTVQYIPFSGELLGTISNSNYLQNIDPANPSQGTTGNHTISTSSYWIVPKGWYQMVCSSDEVKLQIQDGSSNWIGNHPPSGLFESDGSTTRIYNSSASGQTVYYYKIW